MPWVYFIGAKTDIGLMVKVGTTDTDPYRRFRTLQTTSPIPLIRLGLAEGGKPLERKLHQRFARCRCHGEWFLADDEMLGDLDQHRTNWWMDRPTGYECDLMINVQRAKLRTMPASPQIAAELERLDDIEGMVRLFGRATRLAFARDVSPWHFRALPA